MSKKQHIQNALQIRKTQAHYWKIKMQKLNSSCKGIDNFGCRQTIIIISSYAMECEWPGFALWKRKVIALLKSFNTDYNVGLLE